MSHLFALILCLVFGIAPGFAAADTSTETSRMLVHLLSYIRSDYGGAVQDGKVISPSEFTEQLEFLKRASELSKDIPELRDHREFQTKYGLFQAAVENKKTSAEVARLAGELEQQAITLAKIEITPQRWPDLHQGKRIYDRQCTQCHGATGRGDGPSGTTLEPPPTNFHTDKMNRLPPFQAYNTIRLGVPGTGMASFADLSPRETWDVAFYVVSLRYQTAQATDQNRAAISVTLKEAATLSDDALRSKVGGTEAEQLNALRAIRTHEERNEAGFFYEARRLLVLAQDQAKAGDWNAAKLSAVASYLDGIEPVEPKLRRENPALVDRLEIKMAQVRKAIDLHSTELNDLVKAADALIVEAERVSQASQSNAGIAFAISFGIILREALEAILILMTILGITRSLGSKKATTAIHVGWIAALVMGFTTWFAAGRLISFSGADRELVEGLVALLAVVILVYMGFWLHHRTEIGKWHEFVQKLTKSAMDKKSVMAFALLSFTAVYRETFESVLFLQALSLEVGKQQMWAIGFGAASALILMTIVAVVFSRMSLRIPIRQLCQISSWTMIALAIILLGKAVHAFQEVGIIPMTSLPIAFRFELLGVFPTYETWAAQIIGLVLIVSVYFVKDRSSWRFSQSSK